MNVPTTMVATGYARQRARPACRRAWQRAGLWAALLCAACQPQARRALVLDLTLADPALLDGTARPWRDAGYTVEYRRFYPHLTEADLPRYHTLVVLLGQEPEAPSDALTTGDLAMLSRALRAGRVVVVGYSGDATGSLDRWTVNRWLASEGAGIGIGDVPLEDTTGSFGSQEPQPWAAGRQVGGAPLGSVYEPFPFDRHHALAVRRPSQVLAAAGRHAFVRTARSTVPRPEAPIVAATRVDQGLVVVVSRHALGALGPQAAPTTAPLLELGALANTHDFLTALARWTRRPAEWAHVPPAEHPTSLTLAGAPLPVEALSASPSAPAGAVTEPLGPLPPSDAGPVGVPGWVRQTGMRALWTPLLGPRPPGAAIRPPALDSLVGMLDEAGLNLLAGDADPEALADSAHHRGDERSAVRHAWSDIVTLLQPTSVAWIPALAWPALLPPMAAESSRGTRGEARGGACALDSAVWSASVIPAFTALARLAGSERQLVPALALELETADTPPTHSMGQDFCDAAWRSALARLARHGPLDSVPRAARYQALRDQGLLGAYYQALEDGVAERARSLRDRALREHPGLYFAFRLGAPPGDWFALGVLRGFSLPDRPLLLFTPEIETRSLLAAYRARGLNMVHAVELSVDLLRPRNLPLLKHVVFGSNDGFWLASSAAPPSARHPSAPQPATRDSVANVLRRLAR